MAQRVAQLSDIVGKEKLLYRVIMEALKNEKRDNEIGEGRDGKYV